MKQKKTEIIQLAKKLYNPKIVKVKNTKVKISPSTHKTSKTSNDLTHVLALIDASLQYNFWYSDSLTRLGDSSTIKKMVIEDSKHIKNPQEINQLEALLKDSLMTSGITHLDKRLKSLREVFSLDLEVYSHYSENTEASVRMIETLPGFQKDPFFKKGIFALQLSAENRNKPFDMVVPADYQIPKVLEALGIIEYSPELKNKIDNDVILPEGSKEEVAIRSATIIACDFLAEFNGITSMEVDQWLFNQKNEIKNKHHLCDTTNY